MPEPAKMKAVVDFDCLEDDCQHNIAFDLLALKAANGVVSCPCCHRPYSFDKGFLGKLEKLRTLVLTVRDCEDILGDCNVGVTTPGGEVKIPYRLLLTRLNTLIWLQAGDRKVDFHFRVEPLDGGTFK